LKTTIGIIILAAGASRRMGQAKQLLKIDNQSLIERTIHTATAIENQQTVVVLGANASIIQSAIAPNKAIDTVVNTDWEQGMGTSLKRGLQFLLAKKPALEAVIVLVCDQPFLKTEILEQLIHQHVQHKAPIIATKYGEIKGVPALFDQSLFPTLLQLNKDEGARKIIKKQGKKVRTIDFPEGAIDLDTPEAYELFLNQYSVMTKKFK
jgi:molybdenum cofactor cytidylyltransferase